MDQNVLPILAPGGLETLQNIVRRKGARTIFIKAPNSPMPDRGVGHSWGILAQLKGIPEVRGCLRNEMVRETPDLD